MKSTSKLFLLLVEDHIITQFALSRMFERLGCIVEIAPRAEIAFQKASQNYYDGIILDIGLPDESGTKLARKLNKHCIRHPIIVLTAHLNDEIQEQCLNEGVMVTLTKPLSSEQARDVVEFLKDVKHERQNNTHKNTKDMKSNHDYSSETSSTF